MDFRRCCRGSRISVRLFSIAILGTLWATEARPQDPDSSEIRAVPFAGRSAGPAVAATLTHDGDPLGLMPRLQAALAAAKNPKQPVPRPATTPEAPLAPIASRIGRDVTIVQRPGTGTPMQIRGERLQERVAVAEGAGGDSGLATARTFLRLNGSVLGLNDPDTELVLRKRTDDDLGFLHLKFEQAYRRIPVWPAELVVHLDRRGDVYLLDGSFVSTPKLATTRPVVTAERATRRARIELEASATARIDATELIVYAPGNRAPRLAWKIEISGAPRETATVIIDALTGKRLALISRVMEENVTGSGIDLFGTTVPLNVWKASGVFHLIDTSKPMFDPASDVLDPNKTRGAIYVGDDQNKPPSDRPDASQAEPALVSSPNSGAWNPRDAVSAAFNFSKVYDYYRDRHTRNSIDGQGGNILAVVRLGKGYPNAFWNDAIGGMFFGDADFYAGSLDAVGHEMTHGVTSKTSALIYQDQAGALNEAMSDIFGEMVESYVSGSNDWVVGSRLLTPFRDMSNPARFGDPAKMSQFVNTTSDHGGVHTNSGIINQAYYLLAQGMSGAIGLRDSERIFYRALTLHLTKNSQFLDARLACVQSADEIFGAGSNQSRMTAKAFDAVEIVASTPAPPPPTAPPVNASDSTLLVFRDGPLLLGRREAALGDPAQGSRLSTTPVADERPSVSGDGTLAFFVSSNNDACFVLTNGSVSPSCLGFPGQVASVSMSRDQNVFAFVFLNNGERDDRIGVVDLQKGTTAVFPLVAPATDGDTSATVLFADTLDFTANRRFLLYDNLNLLTLSDGTRLAYWSISAIDFVAGEILTVIPPVRGFDIANPSVARTNDDYFAFESVSEATGKSDLYAAKASTGTLSQVVTGVSGFAAPVYAGDDRALVYSYPDSTANTGRSLARINLAADRLTPSGQPAQWLFDGKQPVIYRRGAYTAPGSNCTPSATALCLSQGRFQVSATFSTPAGGQGVGQAVRLTSDTGYFTFFDPANVEVVVKVLNGCGFNQRLWVFAGGLTNVATVLTVTDTATGVARIYSNPQNTAFQPIQDTSAFSTCFVPSIASAATAADAAKFDLEVAGLVPGFHGTRPAQQMEGADGENSPESATACVTDSLSLCLNSGRFRVQTSFRTGQGQTGLGNAVLLTGDTGYFWFFDPSNVEIVVKVLNGCGFNSRFWTFAGGLTNVQVTMTVTDTQTGAVRTYTNPLNQAFLPLQDTAAFSCP